MDCDKSQQETGEQSYGEAGRRKLLILSGEVEGYLT